MTLDERLDRLLAERDRENMAPTIAALLPLLEQHPDDARVLYEVGGAYDTAGEEEAARGYYERAVHAGLEGDLARRCAVQYGSTLRNLGLIQESLAVFAEARRRFPESAALAAFEALSLHAAHRPDEAIASLLETLAGQVDGPDLDRYKPALRGNAAYLRSLGTIAGPER